MSRIPGPPDNAFGRHMWTGRYTPLMDVGRLKGVEGVPLHFQPRALLVEARDYCNRRVADFDGRPGSRGRKGARYYRQWARLIEEALAKREALRLTDSDVVLPRRERT